MSHRPRILLDSDPGIDDAFAIFCALRFTDLAAVTTVGGNVRIEDTTRNALYILELAGSQVEVHRGAAAPLHVRARSADAVHGVAGLGNHPTPQPSKNESSIDAIDAILDFCHGGNATIVATGPLTNIALAIGRDHTIVDRIAHLHWMGGSTDAGNVTRHAEFNAWADPHAVDVTMRSGVPITMYGLNLTRQVRMGADHVEVLLAAGSTTSLRAAEFLSFYEAHAMSEGDGQPMHDPCAVLGVTHPALFTCVTSPIVAHADEERRGMTEVDPALDGASTTHHIARDADASALVDLIIEAAIDPTPVT